MSKSPAPKRRRATKIYGGCLFVLLGILVIQSLLIVLRTDTDSDKPVDSKGAVLHVYGTLAENATFLTKWDSIITPSPIPNMPYRTPNKIYDHHWLPDGTLLRAPYAFTPQLAAANTRGDSLLLPAISNSLERLDPKTGKILSTFPLKLKSIQRLSLYDPALSPDGRWLFLQDRGNIALIETETGKSRSFPRQLGGEDELFYIASTYNSDMAWMTTPKQYSSKRPRILNMFRSKNLADRVAWLKDSTGFIEAIYANGSTSELQIRSLEDKLIKSIPIKISTGNIDLKLLGITDKNEALLIDHSGYYVQNIYSINLDTGQGKMVPIQGIPRGLLIKQIELSPDGKRILWKTVDIDPSFIEMIGLFIDQAMKRELQFRVSIRVSDIEGATFKTVASEKMSKQEEDGFQTAHWLPDSQHISFWYYKGIYTLDAGKP